MKSASETINDVSIWLILSFAAFLIWFFKTMYSQHQLIYDYYTRNKETDISKIMNELTILKNEIKFVEMESKKYWNSHKLQMDNNQAILLERINHTNDNNKANAVMLRDLFQDINKKIDKLESRIDDKHN